MADPDSKITDKDWDYWHREIEAAKKVRGYEKWIERSNKIIRRYRAEQPDRNDASQDDATDGSRFNILWSNVQTLLPALLARPPKPVVERRYLDRDEVGRTASVILERALLYELDDGTYYTSLRKAVMDRLLPGRGVVWVRYDPTFMPMEPKTQTAVDPETKESQPGQEDGNEPAAVAGMEGVAPVAGQSSPPEEVVASESVPVDYVHWKDFFVSTARTWEEARWIAKAVYMERDELHKRFDKSVGAKVVDAIPLDWTPENTEERTAINSTSPNEQNKRATIYEIWDKKDRKVRWIAKKYSDAILDEMDDPLKLEGFWPTPKPLFATMTNNSLIPIPDYIEYMDQAIELDDITSRISALTKAIKATGCYDASIDELKRMLEEGFENKLVPVDNWAEFSQKVQGGGGVWLLPIKDLIETLIQLYTARDQVKQILYEITGMSDIVRGQASGAAKTATEQRIKSQFASMRLNDMQAEVARFARDTLRIMGEIIAEHYDPMTLWLVSGFEQYAREQWPPDSFAQSATPAASSQPGAGAPAPAGPPLPPAGMLPGMMAPLMLSPEDMARQKAMTMFAQAVKLLRDDKLRGFRIEIETDSLIEPDQQSTQQARSEFLAAVGQFLAQAVPLGEQMPQFMPLMGRMLLFGVRGFRAGHELESAFEQTIEDLNKAAKNPPPKPPPPEVIKSQAAVQQAQLDAQAAQAKHQADLELIQAQAAAKQADFAIEQQRNAMEIEKMRLEMARMAATHRMELEKLGMQGELSRRQADLDAMGMGHEAVLSAAERQHEHELAMESLQAQDAMQASQANGASQ